MNSKFIKAIAGLWPFGILPIFFWLTTEGILSFGGGEKDIVLVVPLGVFALLYSIVYFIALRQKTSVIKSILGAALTAIFLMVVVALLFRSVVGI